jgi:hypothetical protein
MERLKLKEIKDNEHRICLIKRSISRRDKFNICIKQNLLFLKHAQKQICSIQVLCNRCLFG